jgi:exodeoxyribonuclease VII large subunit
MDLLAWVEGQGARLSHALSQGVSVRGQRLRDLARALPRADVLLDGPRQRLDALGERLPAALIRSVQVRRVHLSETAGALRPALLRRAVEGDRRRLQGVAARLNVHALNRDITQKRRDLDRVSARFSDAAGRQMQGWQDRLAALDRLRETLGYKATLKRGYAVVRGDGAVVTTRVAAAGAAGLVIEFADGMLDLSGAGPAVPATKVKPKTPPEGQGTLF